MKKNFYLIKSTEQLQELFNNKTIFLEKGCELIISKKVKLKNFINFSGKVKIDCFSIINNNCHIHNSTIGLRNLIKYSSFINDSKINSDNSIGPFCYIRDKVKVGRKNIIGAHTEITRTIIKDENTVSHFSFIGDCKIGNKNIIGAGVVTANYKSKKLKQLMTVIENNCVLGSNSTVIAPRRIKSEAIIAAGSTITKDVKRKEKIIQKN